MEDRSVEPEVALRGHSLFAADIGLAFWALSGLIGDGAGLVLALMQWLGECPAPWPINSEVGDLREDGLPGGKLFRFLRYDVQLDAAWLAEHLSMNWVLTLPFMGFPFLPKRILNPPGSTGETS